MMLVFVAIALIGFMAGLLSGWHSLRPELDQANETIKRYDELWREETIHGLCLTTKLDQIRKIVGSETTKDKCTPYS